VTTGSGRLRARGTATTGHTYFVAVAYDNINREIRFIVDDRVYRGRGVFDNQLTPGDEGSLFSFLNVTGLGLYDGILSQRDIESMSGIRLRNGGRYSISDRFSPIVAQDRARAQAVYEYLAVGTSFQVTNSSIRVFNSIQGNNVHFNLQRGERIRVVDRPSQLGWGGRLRIADANGITGYIEYQQLRYGTRATDGRIAPAAGIGNGEFFQEFLVTRRIFGVPLLGFVLFIVLAILGIAGFVSKLLKLSGVQKFEFVHIRNEGAIIPAIVMLAGLVICLVLGFFIRPNMNTVFLEMRWYFSAIRAIPLTTSIIPWILHICIIASLYFISKASIVCYRLKGIKGLLAMPSVICIFVAIFMGLASLVAIVGAVIYAMIIIALVVIAVAITLVVLLLKAIGMALD